MRGSLELTSALLAAGARVIAIEIEPVLARLCAELLSGSIEMIESDVLEKGRLNPRVVEALGRSEFSVVSNLPYSSGTPFLCELAVSGLNWRRATVMLESELSRRLAAEPGSKAYGAPTALIGSVARAARLRTVPANVFWPRPRVESAVLSIARDADAPAAGLGEEARRELSRFLSGLFSKRRKMLRNSLDVACGGAALLERLGIDSAARAEDLAPADLVRLFGAARSPGAGSA